MASHDRSKVSSLAALCTGLALMAACSAGENGAGVPAGSGGTTASGGSGAMGGAMLASTGGSSGSGGVIGSPPFTGFEDAGTGLQARIQVAGNHGVCGACAVLSVQAQGGATPYTYEWSDPALSGPGPHTICPKEAVHYSVEVTDSSAVDSPEFQKPAQTTLLETDLSCTEPPPDAGAAPDDGINGCLAIKEDLPKTSCTSLSADETTVGSTMLGFAPTAGKTYQYTYDQLLPIGIGNPSTVDVYLGNEPCERAQKIFTLALDNVWTQSHCFVVEASYKYSTTVVHVNGIPFTFGVIPTICDSCTTGTPP